MEDGAGGDPAAALGDGPVKESRWETCAESLLMETFTYLSPWDLSRELVCKAWLEAGRRPTVWDFFLKNTWPSLSNVTHKMTSGKVAAVRDLFIRRALCMRQAGSPSCVKSMLRDVSEDELQCCALHIEISDTRRGRSLYSALIDVKDHERLSQLFGVCTETGDCASTTSDVVSPRLGALIMQDLCSFFSTYLELEVAVLCLGSGQVAGLASHRLSISDCNHYTQQPCAGMAIGLPHEEEELDVFLYSVPGETSQTSCCSAIQDSCWGEVELQTGLRVAIAGSSYGDGPLVRGVGLSLLVGMQHGMDSRQPGGYEDDDEGQEVIAFERVDDIMLFLHSILDRQLHWL